MYRMPSRILFKRQQMFSKKKLQQRMFEIRHQTGLLCLVSPIALFDKLKRMCSISYWNLQMYEIQE